MALNGTIKGDTKPNQASLLGRSRGRQGPVCCHAHHLPPWRSACTIMLKLLEHISTCSDSTLTAHGGSGSWWLNLTQEMLNMAWNACRLRASVLQQVQKAANLEGTRATSMLQTSCYALFLASGTSAWQISGRQQCCAPQLAWTHTGHPSQRLPRTHTLAFNCPKPDVGWQIGYIRASSSCVGTCCCQDICDCQHAANP